MISLQEYIEQSIKELKKFESNWLKNNKKDPDSFPMELNEGDWGEQELAERFP